MRRSLLMCFGLLLASCDKQTSNNTNKSLSNQSQTPPRVTKSKRPALVIPVDQPLPQTPQEPDTSLEDAMRISSSEKRDEALAAIAWDHFDSNPDLAHHAIEKLTVGSKERIRLIEHDAITRAGEDIEEALKWAHTIQNPDESAIALERIALVLADSDPARAANLISESGMESREFDVAVVQIIQKWATTDAATTAAWVVSFEPSNARSAGIKAVVAQWAERDTNSTLAWIDSLQDGVLHREAVSAMAEAILAQTPDVQEAWKSQVSSEIQQAYDRLESQSKTSK